MEKLVAWIGIGLELLGLILTWAGIILIIEVLGEPMWLQEDFIRTSFGKVSFVQMMYWVMTTITTVGYGDFSPTHALSRMFVVYVIVHGVVFFGQIIERMGSLSEFVRSGLGHHNAGSGDSQRVSVLVCGTGVGKIGEKDNFTVC
jgi:hypothetical protein